MNFSIQQKMFLILGGGFFGFLIYFAVNHSVLQDSRDTLEKIVEVKLPGIERVDQLARDVSTLRSLMIQALVTQNFDGLGKVDETNKKITEQFATWSSENSRHQFGPEASKKVQDLEVTYAAAYAKLIDMVQNIMVGIATVVDAQKNFQHQVLVLAQVESDLGAIKKSFADDLQGTVTEVENQGQKAILFGIILLGIGFIVGALFYLIMAKINGSLLNVNTGIQGTSKKLLEMVEEARLSSQRLRAAANQQAASSTETVVSMEEMKRILSQTSRSSSEARDLSEASLEEATSGKDLVQALRDAMSEIERSNKDLEEVTDVVKMVRENTEVINEIVFKTQLLSFNANIEAARAGQHGLGFAVVANEIGSLSEMSGKAAEEINELLERSTTKVDKTIAQTKEKIARANELSNKCFEFFKKITDRSQQLKEMVKSITQATAEQSTGVEYVVNAMNELNQSAGETDRMAQGVLMLADGLKGQAMGLASAADRLNAIVKGGEINAASGEQSKIYNLPKVDKNHKNLKDSA